MTICFFVSLKTPSLHIEVKRKFVGMGTLVDGVNFVFALVFDPGFDHVVGKDIALEQEVVIRFQCVEGLGQ